MTWAVDKVTREYAGRTYLERVNILETISRSMKWAWRGLGPLHVLPPVRALPRLRAPTNKSLRVSLLRTAGEILRFVSSWAYHAAAIQALHRRSRAVSIPPRLIVCHDIYALAAAVRLKRLFHCPVLYDTHELWPAADLLAPRWEQRLLEHFERRLIRHADRVVTVSPQLSRHLERLYDLDHVDSVPNAEPRAASEATSTPQAHSGVATFLLQGQVAPGRGIDSFIESWLQIDEPRATVCLRCRPNDYLTELQKRFASGFESGRITVAPPVPEEQLVAAARSADVGVIPYTGPNLNHLYACPNKLSQYMAAGLAILTTNIEYVASVVREFDCGAVFGDFEGGSLGAVVDALVSDPEHLVRLRRNALQAARTRFNWEDVSRPYSAAIDNLIAPAAALDV